ncbi:MULTISPECIES: HNH endonuclease [unclassified Coleofasciculus]|uniref:HNH endonuclease n=1 Tax=unclassified Coleofasciculus TaxID=2692782 RepID=UPI001880FCE2|nr:MULTISPECIES: HNH endonuclease signature motif containing protein [unclassified Coleofasciculus]MBE9128636.1 HNH endonuclease [Coleofasciculus sp. LEGE 07081]MBE9147258.1 HNH endonuclease [Coleofasciculus sp. LEGE 07092]
MASQKRPKEHLKVQKVVKQRDGYKCEICGQVTQNAHGHHVIPFSEDGPADLKNMMTLCPDCHKAYHKGDLHVDIWRF